MTDNSKVTEGLETEECFNKDIKVSMEFISDLRAEANRQKARRSVEALLNSITNKSQNLPDVESILEMDKISEDFELTEE
jgi:hypothetical protein